MRIVCFYHSLISDWNHGNAHFLRGVVSEMVTRGHDVQVFEPAAGWSLVNLIQDQGEAALADFSAHYPGLSSTRYDLTSLSLDRALEGADLVIVHEWNAPELVARVGAHRRRGGQYLLLFHDTHHRLVSAPEEMERYDLSQYDGVLAFGEVLRELYQQRGDCGPAFTWHEAADVRVFRPVPAAPADAAGELVWIGNWGDAERAEELGEFLLRPIARLGLRARVYGVRYPEHALHALADAGVRYGGHLPNYLAPVAFASHLMTVHVPRRPYVRALVGVPTIRMFEALACGIPLVSAPWNDVEGLFRKGRDFLFAKDGAEMEACLGALLREPGLRAELSARGRETILARHTCAHRVDELFAICTRLGLSSPGPTRPAREEALAAKGDAECASP
jgi:spore maturation protein CgeB